MSATVFRVFREQEFEYLTIARGEVYGNRITAQKKLRGVVKIREAMTVGDREVASANSSNRSTIHAHPEDFAGMTAAEIIGNGIRHEGVDYTITAVSEGRNFESGELEHLTLTLERANYVGED